MRASAALVALALAGCRNDESPAAPDREAIRVLAAVELAAARAGLEGRDVDSARTAALTSQGATRADYDAWLIRAARDPAAGAELWEAVGRELDSARTAGSR
jgi:hypothetical protein